MIEIKHSLENNVKLLKNRVSKHAIYGLVLSVFSILVATLLVSYQMTGTIDLHGVVKAQQSNVAIWILDTTPFLFTFWGQYVSYVVSYAAGAMVIDQTNELKLQTSALESKVLHESMHDGLTDLPNRMLLIDRFNQALTTAKSENKSIVIMVININGFKEINDGLGHHGGDRVLKQFATRLQGATREPSTVARISSDEFAILHPFIDDPKDAIVEARKIQKAINVTFSFDGVTLDVHAAIGVALFPEHGSDSDTLLQRANVAMTAAKYSGNDFTIYSPKLDKNSPHKLILMGELRRAIDNGDLALHYQPKVMLATGDIIGVEALVRWNHSTFGLMPPEDFIPLAERTGLIRPLTQWVLNEALQQCSKWHRDGMPVSISVNLSSVDVIDVDLPDTVAGMLAAHDIDSKYLKLELIESAFMGDQQRAFEILTRLSEMGVKLSIDDFGTGYSSLSYLTKLPVDEIKIDKSFVMIMEDSKQDATIVRATIDLAHNLGLSIVAEGVCNKSIYEHLIELRCDIGQGFYISEPKNAADFMDWLKSVSDGHDAQQMSFKYSLVS